MRSARLALLAYFAASLLLWSLVPPGFAQGVTGELIVQTDFELIGTSELNGGGHVTWILTGDEAQELRRKIVALFDEYSQIPAGFPVEGTATSRNPNGMIDLGEAGAYTARLENNLEALPPGSTGPDLGYFRLAASDLLFQGSVNRSTTGLIDTRPTSTSNLEIRFFFDGRTTTQDTVLSLARRAFADALHDVFSFRRAQASNLTGSPWPLLAEDGWHVTTVGNVTALWAGNDATGRYEDGASNATRSADLVPSANPGLDFRFATSAYAEVTYRGRVADTNDTLRFEAALPPYAMWDEVDRLNATSGAWRTQRIDLNRYLGEPAVRFRFNFTSDASGNAEGFFLRDFAIVAPSTYEGVIVESQAHYLIGALSFSDPVVSVGSLNVVRTPGGEILWYGATWAGPAPPPDAARFQTFNALENPQALFVLMIVAAYVISRSQEVAWDRFRDAHAAPMRAGLEKTRWLHIAGKVAMALLILLYFIPTAFYNLGLRVFVSGPAYWILAVTVALALGLGTRVAYQVRLERSAPLGVTKERSAAAPGAKRAEGHCTHCLREIGNEDRTYVCTCGSGYHLTCASDLERCTNCRRPMAVEVARKARSVSIRCSSCGEVQTILEDADPRAAKCSACGHPLRHLEEGKGYLLVAANPGIAFAWLQDLVKGGKPGLVLSPAAPDRLRLEYGLQGIDVVHVSASAAKGVDPKRLDPDGLRAILPLSRSDKGGVVLYDGLEAFVREASLAEVTKFLRKANDMAFVHRITVLARLTPGTLGDSEVERLGTEFDESIDLTARA